MRYYIATGLLEKSSWRIIGNICFVVLIICMFLVLNACSVMKLIQDEQKEETSLSVEDATLQCSDECRDRGQCGKDMEGSDVVLLASSAPALEDHSAAYQANTPVTIVGKEVHSVIQLSDGQSMEMSFYDIVLPDGEQGWVPGWCLGY